MKYYFIVDRLLEPSLKTGLGSKFKFELGGVFRWGFSPSKHHIMLLFRRYMNIVYFE